MAQGIVVSIHIAQERGAAVSPVKEVGAHPGKGLEGDRYYRKSGTYSKEPGEGDVTLIEVEAIEALKRDYGIELTPGEARRNLVTWGIALNHPAGREFTVGKITLHGIRLCEPCSRLEKLACKGVIRGLVHRGGLLAQILTEGTIRVGDAVDQTPPWQESK